MKKFGSIFLILYVSLINLTGCKQENSDVAEKSNSDYLISGTLWTQRSGEYRANCYQVFGLAKAALKNNMEQVVVDKPAAVVLDIDETVLDNSYFEANLIQTNSSYSSDLWKQWSDMKCAAPIPGAIDFLEYAQGLGVEIVYISNRKESELENTKENMKQLGFPEVNPENFLFKKDKSSKIERRNTISEKYNIILFIGDNLDDFDGIFEDRSANYGFDAVDKNKDLFGQKYIILPNAMYGHWFDLIGKEMRNHLIGYSDICSCKEKQ